MFMELSYVKSVSVDIQPVSTTLLVEVFAFVLFLAIINENIAVLVD